MKTIKVTSTFDKPVILNYRMPTQTEGRPGPVFQVRLQARALLQEVNFATDNHYNAFINQNKHLIDTEKILIGKTSGAKAERISNDNKKKEAENAASKVDKVVESIENSAVGIKAKVKSIVSKVKGD